MADLLTLDEVIEFVNRWPDMQGQAWTERERMLIGIGFNAGRNYELDRQITREKARFEEKYGKS